MPRELLIQYPGAMFLSRHELPTGNLTFAKNSAVTSWLDLPSRWWWTAEQHRLTQARGAREGRAGAGPPQADDDESKVDPQNAANGKLEQRFEPPGG